MPHITENMAEIIVENINEIIEGIIHINTMAISIICSF